ncbi:Spy/CpxP family protein refolding chaperone [Altericista sp. CCNU0014]|uniref:Spy/CpxP family protein refolding chaperone n=1 Tax=Altericista sp. CCNU0014 TaxID=3082949 RepID=UPI00384FA46D
MQLTRPTAFTFLGFALGAAVALSIPHFTNDKLPVSAQSASGERLPEETAALQTDTANPPQNARSQRMSQMFQRLNLTPDQIQKLKSIRREYKDRIRDRQRGVREARQAMQQMFGSDTPSSTVLSKFQDVQQKQQSLNQLRFKSLLEMREVLTPAQRQQLADRMGNRKGKSQRKSLLNRPQQ